jgi:hypothetical protein
MLLHAKRFDQASNAAGRSSSCHEHNFDTHLSELLCKIFPWNHPAWMAVPNIMEFVYEDPVKLAPQRRN